MILKRGKGEDMERLTSNGYDFYKEKEYWTPAEAAGFVMGGMVEPMFHAEEDYAEIFLVLNASVEAFKNKKLIVYKEIEETPFGDIHETYCPEFCRYDDVYQRYYLSCFEPLEYMRWIVTEKIIKIPVGIGVIIDDNSICEWITTPNYKKEKSRVYGRIDNNLYEKNVAYYKALKYWTILEGVCLSEGHRPGAYISSKKPAELIQRGYVAGEIQAMLCEGECGEIPCFSPFVLLDHWKKAGFEVSPFFNFVKEESNTGEVKYSWVEDDESKSESFTKKYTDSHIIQIDMKSNNMSEELKIALQAWNFIYNFDGIFNDKFGHLDNIKRWLIQNHPKLSKAAKDRIATVVNINKAGGATSIGEN